MLRTTWRALNEAPLGTLRSGFVVSGPTGGGLDGGFGELLLTLLLGAFCGFIVGFMISSLQRYISLVAGRNLHGYAWTIYGAVAGAALSAFMLFSDKD